MSDRVGVCLCGHGPETHCPDGECIGGGVNGAGTGFSCGCQRWRTMETERARRAFEEQVAADALAIWPDERK
jgi:hypothetical protein